MGMAAEAEALDAAGSRRPTVAELPTLVRGWLAILPLAGLCLGLAAQALEHPGLAAWAWTLPTLAILVVLLIQVATSLARGDVGLDVVAVLSMAGAARPVPAPDRRRHRADVRRRPVPRSLRGRAGRAGDDRADRPAAADGPA